MKKVLVSVIFAFLPLVATLAVPAKPGQWRTLTLADGRQVRAELKGDEFMHFWQTEDGERLVRRGQSFLPAEQTSFFEEARTLRMEREAQRRERLAKTRAIGADHAPYVGKKRGLIVLVQFNDLRFSMPDPIETFGRVINGENFVEGDFKGSVMSDRGQVPVRYTLRFRADRNLSPVRPHLFIQHIITIPEIFQPVLTNSAKVLNRHVAGDIPISRLVAALAELSEREMLGKLCVLVYTYFSHNLSCLNSTYGAVTLCSSVAASENHGSRLLVPGLGGAVLYKLLHLLHQSVLLQTNHPGACRTIVR